MNIKKNYSLKKLNTFGIDVNAKAFAIARSVEDLRLLLKENTLPVYILGGGSNLLLTKDLDMLVIFNQIMGKQLERSFTNSVYVSAGGGENWHEFVLWCLEQGYGGIENLSLIPGTVGAAPIQNIGAYGIELKDVFHKLEAFHLKTKKVETFRREDCQFGYRNSVFKNKLKGKYCITKVWFKLSLNEHKIHNSYGAIKDTLAKSNITLPTIKNISDAVIAIRSSKLPDPAVLGNSGSFFKNPEISKTHFNQLKKQYPHIVSYPMPNGKIKVPAGWLIEQAGWKGKRVGNTGAHAKQALVLVNYGNATGQEVKKLAYAIKNSIMEKFGIELTPEVNIL